MELRQYANLALKWFWLVALCTLVAALTSFVVSRRTTPVYEAGSTLLVSQANSPTSGLSYSDLLYSQQVARTYSQLLTEYPVREETARRLGLQDLDGLKRLGVKISASPVRDTQLIQLKVESYDPVLAREIANNLPLIFIEQTQTYQKGRYAQTRADLQAERTKVETDIQQTQERINSLQGQQTLTDEQRLDLSRQQTMLRQFETTYASLLNSLEQLRLTEAQTVDNIAVTTPALTPIAPIRPRTLTNTLLAAIVGAMLALGLAFLVEYLDDTIHDSEQVRDLLGLATLGAILRVRPRDNPEAALVTLDKKHSPIAEGYRVLRTNIQFSGVDEPVRALLITSASPQEGKSTTTANLAVTLAQADQRVILVDTDLRRPTAHKLFNLSNNVGITSALMQRADEAADAVLQDTAVSGLRVLTSGPLPPNPSELLGSERMRHLVERLRSQCDVLIFDSPPVMAAADAAILSTLVDGTLLVIDADSTRRAEALRAQETLAKVGGRLLGVVLNKLGERSSGYYSYYYYYYSRDGKSERRSRSAYPRWLPRRLVRRVSAWLERPRPAAEPKS
ncbi:polysaccharide biosynthesis tyrosine autokinase [Candidatus Amarolinea dominans]|uniref:polysaccharide biosynthesis tyrosine autokinase n=1 Tax=Candidatus Amarolinea dominans TaxID=3140696 RepID=UPI003135CBB3|nr:polysaccharide biosynthesis tyrosine autokinase [Anaerolineae bacterium]